MNKIRCIIASFFNKISLKYFEWEIIMLRKFAYARALQKQAKKLKKDYISYVLSANFQGCQHNMLIEEEKYKLLQRDMPYPNFQEYSILEKVDLIDFRKSYGRNKKRRSLLCRP